MENRNLVRLMSEDIERFVASEPETPLPFTNRHGVWWCQHGYLPLSFVQSWFVDSLSFSFHAVERVADGGDCYSVYVHTLYGWYLMFGASVNALLWRLQDMALLADAAVRAFPELDTEAEAISMFRFVDACIDAIARGIRPVAVMPYEGSDPPVQYLVDDVLFSLYESSVDHAADRGWFEVRYVLSSILSSWEVRNDYFIC